MLQQIKDEIDRLKEDHRKLSYSLGEMLIEYRNKTRTAVQPEDLLGLHLATVVDTQDPLKMGGVRFYTPNLQLENSEVGGLPWAYPVSPMGGFDDSGCIWVPPAGSKIAVFFLNGSRESAFYFGTIWYRDRGVGSHLNNWGYPVREYDCLWEGRRNGYLFGSNKGDQVLPPWKNEMYNGYDIDSIVDFYNDPTQYNSTTYPYIKGFKTEEKHMLKFVEGDPRCNRRWKRVELSSGRGNWLMFKDDHLHTSGQWAFGPMSGDITYCHRTKEENSDPDILLETPKENPCCDCDGLNVQPCLPLQCFPKECPERCGTNETIAQTQRFANPFFGRMEEMRPYWGANTPQANRCMLDQSGVQIQSLSGHQMVMDDSVNQPTGVPTWDRDFDFGCDDCFRGRMWFKSATGHTIELNDQELPEIRKVRGPDNGINFRTASGNFFELNDQTDGDDCDPLAAGPRSGATMSTRSGHLFQMNDNGLKGQFSPTRAEGGKPQPATSPGFEGYVLLRSGYGLQLLMRDDGRQDETDQQFIQLMAPQRNSIRGPHMFVMQEQAETPGFVIMRAGGVYYQSSFDESIEVVGNEANPSSKFVEVTDNYFVDVEHSYFNRNETTLYWSSKHIFLLAGEDCPLPKNTTTAANQSTQSQSQDITNAQSQPGTAAGKSPKKGPCIYSVVTSKDPWVCPFTGYVHYGVKADENGIELDSRSTRVFASALDPLDESTS